MVTREDPITVDAVERHLTTRWLGRPCHSFGSVSSTMDVARRIADGGAPIGTLVVADAQTAGRGRHGRRWNSSPGLGLWFSLILSDEISPGVLAHVLACGVAEGVERYGVHGVAVKWPNDVMVAETDTLDVASDGQPSTWPDKAVRSARKIAGILVERSSANRRSVVGIGINVGHSIDDFPSDLVDVATSVALCTERSVSRAELLGAVLSAVERRLDAAQSRSDADGLAAEWRERSLVLGRLVRVERGEDQLVGRAVEIRADGSLVVASESGTHVIGSGSISFVC